MLFCWPTQRSQPTQILLTACKYERKTSRPTANPNWCMKSLNSDLENQPTHANPFSKINFSASERKLSRPRPNPNLCINSLNSVWKLSQPTANPFSKIDFSASKRKLSKPWQTQIYASTLSTRFGNPPNPQQTHLVKSTSMPLKGNSANPGKPKYMHQLSQLGLETQPTHSKPI